MPKGYVVGQIDINNPERYGDYVAKVSATVAEHGGQYLIRGGKTEVKEGTWLSRTVVIEFPTFEAAKGWYESPAYQEIVGIRLEASSGNLTLVEGVE